MPEPDGEAFPGTVPMIKEAWEVFKELAGEISEEARTLGFPRQLRGAWSKLEAYLARLSLVLALSRVVESDEREQVEPRDVFAAGVLVDYLKAHAKRVFAELHREDPMDALAVALNGFLEERDGKWEGTATELFDALSERQTEGLPGNPDNLTVRVRTIAGRSKALDVKRGWRGKSRVLRLQLLRNGVGSVGGVGEKALATDTTDTANTVFKDTSERTPTITREPNWTPPLSIGEEWEEI